MAYGYKMARGTNSKNNKQFPKYIKHGYCLLQVLKAGEKDTPILHIGALLKKLTSMEEVQDLAEQPVSIQKKQQK